MANIKDVALLDASNRLLNYIVLDVEDESAVQAMFETWGAVRYVEPNPADTWLIDPSPEVWSVWNDETQIFDAIGWDKPKGEPVFTFTLPDNVEVNNSPTVEIEGVVYPIDSGVFFENADTHPEKGVGAKYRLSDYYPPA